MVREARGVSRASSILGHVVPLTDGNCRLTMPLVKVRYARAALPHTFTIGLFKSDYKHSTSKTHICNASANDIDGCNVVLDTNDCWNFP